LVLVVLGGLATIPAGWRGGPAEAAEAAEAPAPAALEHARDTVKMLDDVYKNFVVQITDTYVKAQNIHPAAKVTKKVFQAMDAKGWHSARLVDATGEPVNRANAAKTPFEKAAIESLKKGKSYFEEVGEKDGRPVLRAATVVPVVMKQCISCHPGRKEGDLLGAIVYEVPIK
jgi:hypothetical protein